MTKPPLTAVAGLAMLDAALPTETHRECCRNCPSAPGMPGDPESDDMLTNWSLEAISNPDVLFACGWRPNKLCKGWSDLVRVRVAELSTQGGRS